MRPAEVESNPPDAVAPESLRVYVRPGVDPADVRPVGPVYITAAEGDADVMAPTPSGQVFPLSIP
jgi:hypothetical protein